ncbi:MAG: ABC transporter permease [Gemmatimonadota bacterium]
MREFFADIRLALRGLFRDRGFTVVATATLALGIGANAAIFSVADAVLFRPLPYPEADRLATLWEVAPATGEANLVSSGNVLDWSDALTSFSEIGAYGGAIELGIAGSGDPDLVVGLQVTPSVFGVLGTAPELGRPLPSGATEEPTVVLSHALWESRFGGNPDVLGETILIEEVAYTVMAVMPGEFQFPSSDVQLWLLLGLTEADRESRRSHQWRVIGKLGEDTSLDAARSELLALTSRIAEAHPEFMEGWGARVEPYRADRTRDVRASLFLLLGTVGLVLLIACANVANLLLVRGLDRAREFAVRQALGAGRGRLIRQSLTETGVLTALGLGGGLLLAGVGLDLLLAIAPGGVPFLENARLDARVVVTAAGTAFAVSLGIGLIPALRAGGGGGSTPTPLRPDLAAQGIPRRLRHGFLAAQVAGALVLVAGAGLLVRSLLELGEVDPGFDTTDLWAVSVDVPRARYSEQADQDALYDRFLGEIRAIPGVIAATGTAEPPVVGFGNTFSFVIEGRPRPGANPREAPVSLRAVTPGYFETLGIPLLGGRALAGGDRSGAPPAAVVNDALARRLWPDGDAVGARIRFADEQPWVEIVGVVGDTRDLGLDAEPEAAIYLAHAQRFWPWMSWMTVLVRSAADGVVLAPMLRDALGRVDDQLPVRRLAAVTELYRGSAGTRTFVARLLGAFAGVALLLGTVGVYGVVAYSVARGRREIAIRMALGARPTGIRGAVLLEGAGAAAIGVAVGLVATLLAGRAVEGLLFGIAPTDPLTIAAAVGVLFSAAVAGSWLPARRAALTIPMERLRHG